MKNFIKLNPKGAAHRMVGHHKGHNENVPMISIVARCYGPLCYTEKAFVFVILLKLILPESPYSRDSNNNFLQNIRNLEINNHTILASFDVISPYPSINAKDVIHAINCEIDKQEHLNSNMNRSLKAGLSLIIERNMFIFSNKILEANNRSTHGITYIGPPCGILITILREQHYQEHQTSS